MCHEHELIEYAKQAGQLREELAKEKAALATCRELRTYDARIIQELRDALRKCGPVSDMQNNYSDYDAAMRYRS